MAVQVASGRRALSTTHASPTRTCAEGAVWQPQRGVSLLAPRVDPLSVCQLFGGPFYRDPSPHGCVALASANLLAPAESYGLASFLALRQSMLVSWTAGQCDTESDRRCADAEIC